MNWRNLRWCIFPQWGRTNHFNKSLYGKIICKIWIMKLKTALEFCYHLLLLMTLVLHQNSIFKCHLITACIRQNALSYNCFTNCNNIECVYMYILYINQFCHWTEILNIQIVFFQENPEKTLKIRYFYSNLIKTTASKITIRLRYVAVMY